MNPATHQAQLTPDLSEKLGGIRSFVGLTDQLTERTTEPSSNASQLSSAFSKSAATRVFSFMLAARGCFNFYGQAQATPFQSSGPRWAVASTSTQSSSV